MLRRMLIVLGVTLAAAATLALGAIGVFLLTFEPNDYRGLIEDTVSATLDRQVRLAGDIELVPALIPTLAVNDVSIANPPWASRPTMATAGRLQATIALRPLFDRRIEIAHALLDRVDVLLERGEDGRGNWEFEFAGSADGADSSTQSFETSVERIELTDIAVEYVEPDGTDIETHVDAMTLERSAAGRVSIRATGHLQALPVVAEWQAGPLDDADPLSALRWPITATFSLGETTATMTGRLAAPMAYLQSDFELSVVGRNAGQWLELVGLPLVADLDYELQGRVRIGPDSVQVSGLRGNLIGSEVFGATLIDSGSLRLVRGQRIQAALAGSVSAVPFQVSTRLGLLRDILLASEPWPLDTEAALGEATLSATGTVSSGDGRPRADLSLLARGPVLESLNRVGSFGLIEPGPVALETMLVAEPQQVSLRGLRLSIAGGDVEGDIAIAGLATAPVVSGNLAAATVDIDELVSAGPPATPGSSPDSSVAAPALPDRELPLGWLGAIDGSLTLALGELRGLPFPLADAAVELSLVDGALEITDASARVAAVELSGKASLAQTTGEAEVALELLAQSTDSVGLMQALGIEATPGLSWSVGPAALRLDARGSTFRELIEAGRIDLTASEAVIDYGSGDRRADVALSAVAVSAEPGSAVRLVATGKLEADGWGETLETPFELELAAESLGEIFSGRRWPAIEVSINGSSYREQPLRLEARVTDPAALMNATEFPLSLNTIWGPLTARIDADLVATASLTGTTGDISLATDDLVAAAALLGLRDMPAGEASLSGHVTIGQNAVELGDFAASLPGIDARGQISVGRADRPAGFGEIQFATLDLTPYVAPPEAQPTPADRASPLAFTEFYSDAPIELLRFRGTDVGIDLRAAADEFRLGSLVSNDVGAHVLFERGDVQLELSLDGGRLTANAEIDARDDDVVLRLSVTGDEVPLAVDQTSAPAADTTVMAVDATLTGRGSTTRAIANSIEGDIEIYLARGRIRAGGLRFLFGSVLYQLLDVINPFTQSQDYVEIECVGAYFDVAAGQLTTRNGIVVQMPALQVVGVGGLNLGDGALRMEFQTTRREGLVPSIGGIVNEFVELSGTLDAPRIQVATRRAARTGLIAIATGGLSLIASDLVGRLTADDLCEDLPARVSAR